MAYRITYDQSNVRKKSVRFPRIRWKRCAVLFSAAVLGLMVIIPAGRMWLRDLLLPGDEEVTAVALEGLAEDIESGVSVGEAVDAFCREIIYAEQA